MLEKRVRISDKVAATIVSAYVIDESELTLLLMNIFKEKKNARLYILYTIQKRANDSLNIGLLTE